MSVSREDEGGARLRRRRARRAYVLRRCVLVVPTLLGISMLSFALANLTPGDAAAAFVRRVEDKPAPTAEEVADARQELGLDRPLVMQYVSWVANAAQGDLGRSYATRRSVSYELARRIGPTLQLTALAAALALVVAVPAGIVSAVRRNRPFDHVARVLSLAGASVPGFWLALLLIMLAAVHLQLLPAAGRQGWSSFILPTITLAVTPAATLSRFTRSTLLEVLGEDYVRTAHAKGAPRWRVVGWHAFRPALVPLVTALSLSIGALLSGAVVAETIFVWPGVGKLTVDAIQQRDYPMIQGIVLYTGTAFALINLVVDMAYTVIDPRIGAGVWRDAA